MHEFLRHLGKLDDGDKRSERGSEKPKLVDLHPQRGQVALRGAGLVADFQKHSLPPAEVMKLIRSNGSFCWDEKRMNSVDAGHLCVRFSPHEFYFEFAGWRTLLLLSWLGLNRPKILGGKTKCSILCFRRPMLGQIFYQHLLTEAR